MSMGHLMDRYSVELRGAQLATRSACTVSRQLGGAATDDTPGPPEYVWMFRGDPFLAAASAQTFFQQGQALPGTYLYGWEVIVQLWTQADIIVSAHDVFLMACHRGCTRRDVERFVEYMDEQRLGGAVMTIEGDEVAVDVPLVGFHVPVRVLLAFFTTSFYERAAGEGGGGAAVDMVEEVEAGSEVDDSEEDMAAAVETEVVGGEGVSGAAGGGGDREGAGGGGLLQVRPEFSQVPYLEGCYPGRDGRAEWDGMRIRSDAIAPRYFAGAGFLVTCWLYLVCVGGASRSREHGLEDYMRRQIGIESTVCVWLLIFVLSTGMIWVAHPMVGAMGVGATYPIGLMCGSVPSGAFFQDVIGVIYAIELLVCATPGWVASLF